MVVLFVLFGTVSVLAADNTAKAEALVKMGVAYLKSAGEEKAYEEFNNKKGEFVKGELYLFVVDFNGLTIAHGGNNALVGQDMKALKDADGKFFIQEMIDLAKTKGSGWTEYKYRNPKTSEVQPKRSYVERVGDTFIGCGIYKN
jgi:signal transduction histidine kinase